ncbi:ATP-grasp domain-containing protein [Candidatus Roizmanbacteria bacterium]|nr:ATP-grasp domain-containing protein [Candidatus Roizmanbacteria bacterium]
MKKNGLYESDLKSYHTDTIQSKTILVVNTGSLKKKFTLQRLKKLGVKTVVLNKEKNWAQPYADHWILADTYDHKEAIEAVELFIKNNPSVHLDGALTFWEDNVLLTSKIIDKFNWIGIPYHLAKKARNKFLFREFCKNNGITSPQHMLIRNEKDIKYVLKNYEFPLVVKPVYGSSSAYVIKVEDEEEFVDTYSYIKKNLSTNIESALSDGSEIFVEEYIDGDEVDIDIILQHGKIKFCSLSDNDQTNEPFFVETGQSIPSSLPSKNQAELIEMAEETLEKMGVQNGVIHFEAKSTKAGPVPIEVNLRMGGDEVYSFVKGAWGVDLIENSVKVAAGLFIKIKKTEVPLQYLTGRYFLSDHSGVLVQLDIPDDVKRLRHVEELHFYKRIGDAVLVPPEGYEYLGWVTVKGDNLIDAEDNLEEIVRQVKYEIVKFDSDSSMGKTSRKNRFSSAVLNKNLVVRAAKIESIQRFSKSNKSKLHIGIVCNLADDEIQYKNGKRHVRSSGKYIEEVLLNAGYKVTVFDIDNLAKAYQDLRTADVDLIFNACERLNGSLLMKAHIPALLDMLQVPYTGSSSYSLSLCMDKIQVKKLLSYHDIPTPRWDYAYEMDDEINPTLRYPLIVKPSNADNSIGVTNESVVTNKRELQRQLERVITKMRRPALVEEYIEGDEYDVSILGNEDENDLQVRPLARSIFKNLPAGQWNIYTYQAKWFDDTIGDKIVVQRPAKNINKQLERVITEIALDTYNILDCRDYGRVEIKVDKDNNPYVLELNPNPTLLNEKDISHKAKLMNIAFEELIEEIISMTIKRYKKRFLPYTYSRRYNSHNRSFA